MPTFFPSQTYFEQFVELAYGSYTQYQRVKKLFEQTHNCSKPLFIVTAGSARNVIATLVLSELSQFVDGVYQTTKVDALPAKGCWDTMHKYDVIIELMHRFGSAEPYKKILFVDDDASWKRHDCDGIEFHHVVPNDSMKPRVIPSNKWSDVLNQICFQEDLMHCCFCESFLNELTLTLEKGECAYDYLFFDWDNTLSALNGPLPFTNDDFATIRYLSHPKINMMLPNAIEHVQHALTDRHHALLSHDGLSVNARALPLTRKK